MRCAARLPGWFQVNVVQHSDHPYRPGRSWKTRRSNETIMTRARLRRPTACGAISVGLPKAAQAFPRGILGKLLPCHHVVVVTKLSKLYPDAKPACLPMFFVARVEGNAYGPRLMEARYEHEPPAGRGPAGCANAPATNRSFSAARCCRCGDGDPASAYRAARDRTSPLRRAGNGSRTVPGCQGRHQRLPDLAAYTACGRDRSRRKRHTGYRNTARRQRTYRDP